MSTALVVVEQLPEPPAGGWPHSVLPLLPTEVRKARLEDPGFAEVLGRARAKAMRVEYRPELHYPYRPGGTKRDGVAFDQLERFEAKLEEWRARGTFNPYLQLVK